jgi:hypothetical protein
MADQPSTVKASFAASVLVGLLLAGVAAAQNARVERPPLVDRTSAPDLIVKASDVRIDPERPRPDEEVVFEVAVLNLGRSAARTRIVCELVSNDREADRVLARQEFEAEIDVNHSHVVRWTTRMPRRRNVRLVAEARAESGSEDANPDNNRAVVAVPHHTDTVPQASVTVRAPSLPDVTITGDDITVDPEAPSDRRTVRVTARVRNIGTADAANASASFYLYVDGRLTQRKHFKDFVPRDGSVELRWSFTMPRARRVLLSITVGAPNDSDNRNGWAEKWIRY